MFSGFCFFFYPVLLYLTRDFAFFPTGFILYLTAFMVWFFFFFSFPSSWARGETGMGMGMGGQSGQVGSGKAGQGRNGHGFNLIVYISYRYYIANIS